MSLTPFLGQDLTAYRIDNTMYSITYSSTRNQNGPSGLSDVRRQIGRDEQDGPASKSYKADL